MATKDVEKSKSKQAKETSAPENLLPMGFSSFPDLDRIFDDYFNRNWLRGFHGLPRFDDLWGTYEMRAPSMDVIDRDKEIFIRAELPGVNKNDLDVSVSDNILTIKGNSQQERKEEKDEYHRREIRSGSFCRSLTLPNNVDTTNIKAEFNNGLLELTLPKKEKSRKKTIEVG